MLNFYFFARENASRCMKVVEAIRDTPAEAGSVHIGMSSYLFIYLFMYYLFINFFQVTELKGSSRVNTPSFQDKVLENIT